MVYQEPDPSIISLRYVEPLELILCRAHSLQIISVDETEMQSIERRVRAREAILLIGAGFTKPFGGYLATQMVSEIFNHPDLEQQPEIRTQIRQNLDYESVYSNVQASKKFDSKAKTSLTKATVAAYEHMLEAIFESDPSGRIPYAAGACRSIISPFAGCEKNERGFLFSLNQDLFVERFYSNHDVQKMMEVPGLRPSSGRWFNYNLTWPLCPDDYVALPGEREINTVKQDFWANAHSRLALMKLHGSYAWTGKNGSHAMVIGLTKSELIRDEPLLRWYFDVLRKFSTCLKGS